MASLMALALFAHAALGDDSVIPRKVISVFGWPSSMLFSLLGHSSHELSQLIVTGIKVLGLQSASMLA